MVYKNKKVSYRELDERVNSLVHSLNAIGIKKGDRVALILDNRPEYIELMLAAAKGGFIVVPINTKLKEELNHIIRNASPNTFIVEDKYLDKIKPDWKFVKNVVCMEGSGGKKGYHDLVSRRPRKQLKVEIEPEDPLYIYYTSGTTSVPKGAVLTHKNIMANIMNNIVGFGVREDTVVLAVLPFYFVAGTHCQYIPTLFMGGTVVMLDKFDPESFLQTVEKERVTHTQVVPTMIVRLLEHPRIRDCDTSSLKVFGYGSASMPAERLRRSMEIFGRVFLQSYGLSESTSCVTYLRKEDHIVEGTQEEVNRLKSCGKEGILSEVKVVREDGTEVNHDGKEAGEIVVKGDMVMKEYWNMPDRTAGTVKNGRLYTGDLATVDKESFIYIVDRKKDMIVSGAINIYPREIEEVLYQHPAVLEATVVGLPDEEWGEAVTAFIVLREGKKATEEEIIEFCKEHLASYKKPKTVRFVSELPKTSSGKIQKRKIKEMYS